jgi:hypothetical protein
MFGKPSISHDQTQNLRNVAKSENILKTAFRYVHSNVNSGGAI